MCQKSRLIRVSDRLNPWFSLVQNEQEGEKVGASSSVRVKENNGAPESKGAKKSKTKGDSENKPSKAYTVTDYVRDRLLKGDADFDASESVRKRCRGLHATPLSSAATDGGQSNEEGVDASRCCVCALPALAQEDSEPEPEPGPKARAGTGSEPSYAEEQARLRASFLAAAAADSAPGGRAPTPLQHAVATPTPLQHAASDHGQGALGWGESGV